MMKCQIKGCSRKVLVVRHQLCLAHYRRFQRAQPKTQADVQRFLAEQRGKPLYRRLPAAAEAAS